MGGRGARSLALAVAAGAACGAAGAPPRGPARLSQRLFEGAADLANQSLHGAFVSRMADGSLPPEAFERYLYQDNLYLGKYSRAFAALASRATTGAELIWLANYSVLSAYEHGPGAGRALDDVTFDEEAMPVTVEYTSFFTQAVWAEKSPIIAYASLLPCQRLYDWLFATLAASGDIPASNPYRAFILQYADPRVHRTTEAMEAFLDGHAARGLSDDIAARATEHYRRAMQYEADFFAQGLEGVGPSPPPDALPRGRRRALWPQAARGGAGAGGGGVLELLTA